MAFGHPSQKQTQEEESVAELQQQVANLKTQLDDQKVLTDNAEKKLAEAKISVESLQGKITARSIETGLEQGLSNLQLQDVSGPTKIILCQILLRSEKVIHDGDIITTSKFLEDPEKYGAVFGFEQVFNHYWRALVEKAQEDGKYPDLPWFFSGSGYGYGSLMTPAEEKLKKKSVQYYEKYVAKVGTDKDEEKERKKERKDKARAVAKAIKEKVEGAKIADTDLFSSVADKIVVAIDSVFDCSEYADSFGIVTESSRRTLAVLLAVIQVSAGDKCGEGNESDSG